MDVWMYVTMYGCMSGCVDVFMYITYVRTALTYLSGLSV